jgi:hypothetical protein
VQPRALAHRHLRHHLPLLVAHRHPLRGARRVGHRVREEGDVVGHHHDRGAVVRGAGVDLVRHPRAPRRHLRLAQPARPATAVEVDGEPVADDVLVARPPVGELEAEQRRVAAVAGGVLRPHPAVDEVDPPLGPLDRAAKRPGVGRVHPGRGPGEAELLHQRVVVQRDQPRGRLLRVGDQQPLEVDGLLRPPVGTVGLSEQAASATLAARASPSGARPRAPCEIDVFMDSSSLPRWTTPGSGRTAPPRRYCQ